MIIYANPTKAYRVWWVGNTFHALCNWGLYRHEIETWWKSLKMADMSENRLKINMLYKEILSSKKRLKFAKRLTTLMPAYKFTTTANLVFYLNALWILQHPPNAISLYFTPLRFNISYFHFSSFCDLQFNIPGEWGSQGVFPPPFRCWGQTRVLFQHNTDTIFLSRIFYFLSKKKIIK